MLAYALLTLIALCLCLAVPFSRAITIQIYVYIDLLTLLTMWIYKLLHSLIVKLQPTTDNGRLTIQTITLYLPTSLTVISYVLRLVHIHNSSDIGDVNIYAKCSTSNNNVDLPIREIIQYLVLLVFSYVSIERFISETRYCNNCLNLRLALVYNNGFSLQL